MYRTTIDGKEIIITLAPKIRKEITDRNPLYEAVFHNLCKIVTNKATDVCSKS